MIRLFTPPLGIPGCTIKYICGFEHLKLPALCIICSFRKQYLYLFVCHWFKREDGFTCLIQNLHTDDTGNNNGNMSILFFLFSMNSSLSRFCVLSFGLGLNGCYANVRVDFSRSHWRVIAAAMNASLSLVSRTPGSGLTFAIFKRACPPLSAAIALR